MVTVPTPFATVWVVAASWKESVPHALVGAKEVAASCPSVTRNELDELPKLTVVLFAEPAVPVVT